MSRYFSRRYPVRMKEYIQSVGHLLPHRIGQIFQELGFGSWIAIGQSNAVDLKVYTKGNLILVGEIINWSSHTRMSDRRKNWIVKNLLHYKCSKLLIYTAFENEYVLRDFPKEISLLKLGFQLQPRYFYDHFAKRNQLEFREIDSQRTREIIKSKLIEYLQSSNIDTVSFEDEVLTVTEV